MGGLTRAAPLVTLSLKAYNQRNVVGAAIASALVQSYSPLEIILSDDASSDGTFEVMRDMAAAYRGPHRVILNRNPDNLGIVGHLNRLATMAGGRLLVDASGDDVAAPDRVARLAEVWRAGAGRIKAVHSRFVEIDDTGAVIGDAGPPDVIVDRPGPDPLTIVRSGANCVGAAAAWDLDLFERFGPIPDDCHVSDGPLFFRAALLGGVAYVDAPLVQYRVGGISKRLPRSPGFDYLYGDRIKFARWRLSNARSFLRDLGQVDCTDKPECARLCLRIIERFGFEVDLAERNALSRVAIIPRAAVQSLRARDRYFLLQSLKHALGYAYVAYFNARNASDSSLLRQL